MSSAERDVQTGVFELFNGRGVFGSVRVAGKGSLITLFGDQEFPPVPSAYRYLTGELHNGERITLIDCVIQGAETRRVGAEDRKCSARLFPNTVITGPRHVSRDDRCVRELAVALKDAHSVFYDFDAFSPVFNPTPFMRLLEQDKAHIRPIEIGPNPRIGYFSGKHEIAMVDCSLGEIKVSHRTSESMGGPTGWGIRSQIVVSLRFHEPLSFSDAMRRQHTAVRFFEMIIGREQPLLFVEARLEGQDDREPSMQVVEAYAPRVDELTEDEMGSPAPRDVLMCTAEGAEEFCSVAARYFELDNERADARVRLRGNLGQGRAYTIDRVVSAANMFDIFPDSAYPARVELSSEMEAARLAARNVFKALPTSIERDSVLNALGRMGDLSLKRKVLSRLQVASLPQDRFKGIDLVMKEAINCRNHYVHGSSGVIDYSKNFDAVIFFTDALEFVFGVSDLVDCGWSYDRWAAGWPQESHPFGGFRLGYKERFQQLEALLSQSWEASEQL